MPKHCQSWEWPGLLATTFVLLIAPIRLFGSTCPALTEPLPAADGTEMRGQLSPAAHDSYWVYLSSGSVLRIILEQDAPNLTVCVFSWSGKELQSVQSRFRGEFVTSFAPAAAGKYGVVIAATGSGSVGGLLSYRLRIEKPPLRSPTYATTLNAERAFLKGNALRGATPPSALRSALSQYRIAEQAWAASGDVNGEVRALIGAAEVLLDLSEYSYALQTIAHAEHLGRRTIRLRVRAINGRTRIYLDQWNSMAALQSSEEAIVLSRSTGDRLAEGDALASRGEAYYLQTNDTAAAIDLQDALTIAKVEGDRFTMARALRALAWVNEDQGKLYEAKRLMQEAEQLFRQIGDVRASTNAIGDIATIESIRGDAYTALSTHLKSLQLLHHMGQRSGEVFMLEALGTDYLQLNETITASGYFSQALRGFTKLGHLSGRQEALLEICRTELAIGNLNSAWRYCSESIALVRKLHDPKREAIALRDLGAVEDARGRTAKAVALYLRAADLSHTVHDPRFEATALVSVGRIKEREGDHQAAISIYKQAVALSQEAEAPDSEIKARYEMARSENSLDRVADAQSELDQALLLAEKRRAAVRNELLRASYFASVRRCYDLYVQTLMKQHSHDPAAGFDAAALEKTEQGRARALLEALNELGSGTAQEPNNVEAMARLRRVRYALTKAYERRLKLLISNAIPQTLTQNERTISLLTTEYERMLEDLREIPSAPQSISRSKTIKQVLNTFAEPGTVIVEYMLDDDRSFAWRIVDQNLTSFILPSKKILTRDVQQWRKLLIARKPERGESFGMYNLRVRRSDRELQRQGQRLACKLLKPLEGIKADQLILIVDGLLDSIPFAALPLDVCGQGDGPPLLASYQIVKLPSLLVLPTLRAQEEQHSNTVGEVAVLADPVFSRDDPRISSRSSGTLPAAFDGSPLGIVLRDIGWSTGLPRLIATRNEAKAIAAKSRTNKIFVGLDFDANLANAVSLKLSQFRILHFATHGLLDPKHPELSGLVFSLVDKNGRDIDGYLQAQEIYRLRLQANLVVLSACNSGLGKPVSGEGTIGLTRAFVHAGVPHVLSTLWSIEDEATSELMGQFYDAVLDKKVSPASALREAQLHLLRDKRWSHPFYWAGFTLTGDWH
jgi:CHAT domain-containing protein